MRLTFSHSRHSRGRARLRSITNEEIDAALNDPEEVLPESQPGRRKYVSHPRPDGYRVVVIASDPPSAMGHVTIVTCLAKSVQT